VGLVRDLSPVGYVMPESPLLFSLVVPAGGSFFLCGQEVDGSGGVVALAFRPAFADLKVGATLRLTLRRVGEAKPTVDPIFRVAAGEAVGIPGLLDSSISRTGNLASESRGTTPRKTQNSTNEATKLLKTQEVTWKRS